MTVGPVEGDEVRQAVHLVDDRGAQLAARPDRPFRYLARQPPGQQRKDDADEHEEREEDEPERDVEDAEQHAGERGHQDRDDRRHEHADVEVLERLDIGDDPGQQVAASAGRQARRRERLDRGIEPDPHVGQDPKGRDVRRVPLEIAECRPADGQDPDGGDREGELGDVVHHGGPADEERRHRHEGDVGRDGQEAEERAGRNPAPMRRHAARAAGRRVARVTRAIPRPQARASRSASGAASTTDPSSAGHAARSPANAPPARCSSAGGPISTSRPASRTATRSDVSASRGRCEMATIVCAPASRSSSATIVSSPVVSRCAVGSSRSRTPGSRSSARAIARRCRWPPLSRVPPSPTLVSSPPGRSAMISAAPDRRTASSSSRVVAAGRARRRLSAIVPWKRRGDCGTYPTAARQAPSSRSARSTPPTRIRPSSGSRNRSRRAASVDLPAPLGPTIVSRPPGGDGERHVIERAAIALGVLVAHAIEGDGRRSRDLPVSGRSRCDRRVRRRCVQDREQSPGGDLAGGSRVVALGQDAQRQEELGRDDEHGEGALERNLTHHQAQAHLDGDQRHGHGAGPIEHEPGLECAPEDLQRRLAELPADRPHGADLLGAAAERLERGDAAQHVHEVGAHPAQLGEAALADRPRPAPDQREEQEQDGAREHEDEGGRRIDDEDDAENEERHGRRERPRGQVRRHPCVEPLEPVDEGACQVATPFGADVRGSQLEEAPGHVAAELALEPAGCPLREHLGREQEGRPASAEEHERDQQGHDRVGRSGFDEDRGDHEAEQQARRDDASWRRGTHRQPQARADGARPERRRGGGRRPTGRAVAGRASRRRSGRRRA